MKPFGAYMFRIFPAFLVLTKQQQRNDHLSIFIFIPSSSTSTTAVTAAATAVFLRNQSANQCLHSSNTTRIRASQRKKHTLGKLLSRKFGNHTAPYHESAQFFSDNARACAPQKLRLQIILKVNYNAQAAEIIIITPVKCEWMWSSTVLGARFCNVYTIHTDIVVLLTDSAQHS